MRDRSLPSFGPKFGSHYRWAANVVGDNRPMFEQIEDAAAMVWLAQRISASHSTSTRRLGRFTTNCSTGTRGSGWTDLNGLTSPAIMTIRSLFHATWPCSCTRPARKMTGRAS